MIDFLLKVPHEFWYLMKEMSIYLILGFAVAGVLSAFISPEIIERHLGGRGQKPIWKATLFGIPLPLCSCGVIPVAASLRQHGASKGSTTSFLLSTPQTGVDSILVTWGLLGPIFAVFRPLAALVTGLVGGTVVSAFEGDAKGGVSEPVEACNDGCGEMPTEGNRFRNALVYGFYTLPRDIAKALIFGMAVAAVISAAIPANYFADSLGSGPLGLIVMMLVGIPIYVCATGSVPLALAMIHMGISPGAALVFLITGPATNTATLATVWKILGKRSAIVYLLVVAVFAILSGWLLDFLFTQNWVQAEWMPAMGHEHETVPSWLKIGGAWALVAMMLVALVWPRLPKSGKKETDMDKAITLKVNGMTCEHCAGSVRRAVGESPGVSEVQVDLGKGQASFNGSGYDLAQIRSSIEALGYSVGD
ncbi:SO_0444 family Cu/Zn efflux transporter [bacterium]|nr:SO_0444 family Cu/Zn efflux transporter [bacterium]